MNISTASSAKRILIAEDDVAFSSSLRGCLEREGHSVKVAANGKVARSLVSIEEFDLLISDIRMPELNGIQLLHFVKQTRSIPVILMTGAAEMAECEEALDIGADEFLRKPFQKEELLRALQECCNDSGVSPLSTKMEYLADADYCKVSIDDFIKGSPIRSGIFVRLSSNKYLKVANDGADLSAERINAYKARNIVHLHMRKEDFRHYVGFNLDLAKAARIKGLVPKEKKLRLLKHTGEVILEQLYQDKVDLKSLDAAHSIVESAVASLSDDQDLHELLTILSNHGDSLYAHSLGVSMYAVMVARMINWSSPVTLFKVAVGGLLHDIGMKEIDQKLLERPRSELDPTERRLLESHTERGMEILSKIPSLNSDIVYIASQHHERSSGSGYPGGIKHSRIHPLARLIAVVDEFCELTLKGPQGPMFHPQDAIHRMLAGYNKGYDPVFLGALMRLFKMKLSPQLARVQPKG